jgi:hypothetical protein
MTAGPASCSSLGNNQQKISQNYQRAAAAIGKLSRGLQGGGDPLTNDQSVVAILMQMFLLCQGVAICRPEFAGPLLPSFRW